MKQALVIAVNADDIYLGRTCGKREPGRPHPVELAALRIGVSDPLEYDWDERTQRFGWFLGSRPIPTEGVTFIENFAVWDAKGRPSGARPFPVSFFLGFREKADVA